MSALPLALLAQLAASCAPTVAPETLLSVVRTESAFNTTALHDNTGHRGIIPATEAEAAALATGLIAAGHSVDIGLAQINSANLRRLGLTVAQALDPCTSLRAGAALLVAAYRHGAGFEPQHEIRVALSQYNTGTDQRGFANGYVRRVELSAVRIIPAIRLQGPVPSASALRTPAVSSAAPCVRQLFVRVIGTDDADGPGADDGVRTFVHFGDKPQCPK